jgi:16S rRNA (uracil1498-N3)-methyltransferase
MNMILLFESDFISGDRSCVRLLGRRREHIVSVCNASEGSLLRVGLLDGKTGTGKVLEITGESIDMHVELDKDPPEALPFTLIVSLPRPKSFLKCVETATIHGVKRIFFIHSYRVEKNYWGSQRLSDEAIREHIFFGLEQSRDTVMPRIEFRRRFKPFVEDELPGIIDGALPFIAHPYSTEICPYNVGKRVVLMIGPEGGFIPYEIELCKKIGFSAVSFGSRILRVEQAVSALIGRLF